MRTAESMGSASGRIKQFVIQALCYGMAAVAVIAATLAGIWFVKNTPYGLLFTMTGCAGMGIILFLTMRAEERRKKRRSKFRQTFRMEQGRFRAGKEDGKDGKQMGNGRYAGAA